jgi:hypothetical protein
MNVFTRSTVRAVGTVAALTATGVMGCAAGDALEPVLTDNLLVVESIRVTLEVVPDRLHSPGEVVAVLKYENLGDETVVLGSSMGCLAFAAVYRGDELVPFPATQYACTAAVSYRDLEPGRPLTMRWPLSVGSEEGFHAPEGSYRFVANLLTHPYDLEATFIIG